MSGSSGEAGTAGRLDDASAGAAGACWTRPGPDGATADRWEIATTAIPAAAASRPVVQSAAAPAQTGRGAKAAATASCAGAPSRCFSASLTQALCMRQYCR